MVESKRLWDIEHSYYCREEAWNSSGDGNLEYKTFADFVAEMGTADKDYNLLFRWDWDERDDNGEPTYNGDDYYRNGKLKTFWMQQRKGLFVCMTVEVCRADEPAVRAFLAPFWEHMRELWEPLAGDPHQTEGKQS